MQRNHRVLSLEVGAIAAAVIAWLLAGCAGGQQPLANRSPYVFSPAPAARELLLADRFDELNQRFSAAQNAYRSGIATDQELRVAIREFYDTDPSLGPKYDAWVARFSNSYVAHLARGIYYARVGGDLRGVNSMDDTPSESLLAADSAYDKAMAELAISIRLDPKPIFSFVNFIYLSRERGDLSESRRWLDKADSIDPGNYVARAMYMSAIETRWGGSQQIMRAFLEECRAAKLSDNNMHLLESVVIEDQGWIHQFVDHDYAAAEADYRKSGALGGDKQLANLSAVLFEQGKYREALEPLNEELQARPNDPEILTNRSEAYFEIGMSREGIADLHVAADGGNSYAQNNLGRYYMIGIPGILAADPRTALEWFKKSAAQGNPAGQQNLEHAAQLFGDPPSH
jgi:tetratricopeptide (TPR) repeat protein